MSPAAANAGKAASDVSVSVMRAVSDFIRIHKDFVPFAIALITISF